MGMMARKNSILLGIDLSRIQHGIEVSAQNRDAKGGGQWTGYIWGGMEEYQGDNKKKEKGHVPSVTVSLHTGAQVGINTIDYTFVSCSAFM